MGLKTCQQLQNIQRLLLCTKKVNQIHGKLKILTIMLLQRIKRERIHGCYGDLTVIKQKLQMFLLIIMQLKGQYCSLVGRVVQSV